MLPLQRQTPLRCGDFLDSRKCQRSYHLKYYFYLLLHSSLTYTKDEKESAKMPLTDWFTQSFYKVERSVRPSYWKGNMDWVYLARTRLSPLSGSGPSLVDTKIWCMYSIWEVFFLWEQFHSLQQKNIKVTRMYQCVLFCSISWYMILLSTFYIWQLIITVNFLW